MIDEKRLKEIAEERSFGPTGYGPTEKAEMAREILALREANRWIPVVKRMITEYNEDHEDPKCILRELRQAVLQITSGHASIT